MKINVFGLVNFVGVLSVTSEIEYHAKAKYQKIIQTK
jgi:hypothetical protein